MNLLRRYRTVDAFLIQRRAQFKSRKALDVFQECRLHEHLAWLHRNNAYFRFRLAPHLGQPAAVQLGGLPASNKASWLELFDECNTAGLRMEQMRHAAATVYAGVDAAPMLNGYRLGQSWAKGATQDLHVFSEAESARWTGTLLGKLLLRGILAPERVAFFAHPKSNRFVPVESAWARFRFFDVTQPLEAHKERLAELAPTIVVASTEILCELAAGTQAVAWAPCTAAPVEGCIDEGVRKALGQRFAAVRPLYLVPEGLLATACSHGSLHLNEENVYFEAEWVDEDSFVPFITDMTRRTQPLVRYRMDQVFRVHREPCGCGSPAMTLAAMERL